MRVPLISGYYEARSLIASAQRCLNLYPEKNMDGAPAPFSDYPTPGLTLLANPPVAGVARGAFTAGSGDLYVVIGTGVYYVSPLWQFTLLGTIAAGTTPVTATDNGLDMLLADGTSAGYQIELGTRVMTTVTDPNFFGAVRLDEMDTYMVGNIPGTRTFFSSNLNAVAFDPLYQANKSGASDELVTVVVVNREIWLIGATSSEIWFNSGAPDFPFQIMAGPFIQYGCAAPYSLARQGSALFWLGQDKAGGAIILKGEGYKADRISTNAIEAQIGAYATLSDAIGFCYQQGGHQFYMLTFPTADKTWCYDVSTNLWHERCWTDANGEEHRHRAVCGTYAYSTNVVLDWQTGALYSFDLTNFTDNGSPIVRRRGFPHMVDDGNRVIYTQLVADMEVGNSVGTSSGVAAQQLYDNTGGIYGLLTSPNTPSNAPQVNLRWSDDRGATWSNALMGSLGAAGEYLTSVQFRRLGMARDRVFELFWSASVKTSLQGAFITAKKLGT